MKEKKAAPMVTEERPGTLQQAVQLLLWLLVIEILSFIAWPWIAATFPALPDAGFGLSKVFGLIFGGWFVWLLQSLGILTGSASGAVFALLVLAFLTVSLFKNRLWISHQAKVSFAMTGELLFIGSFLILSFIRSFQPEIFWGEKPMDSTFLNYFYRLSDLPPDDPWAAGQTMHYYYLSSYIFALLGRLSGALPSIGYNLALVTISACLIAALYSLLLLLTRNRVGSIVAAILVFACSNLEWLRLHLGENQGFGFDLFWATTRLFRSPAFAEYPLWSFLFGDLHAHVAAVPVLVVFFAFIAAVFFFENEGVALPRHIGTALRVTLLGLIWGCFVPLNAWDYLNSALVAGVLFIFSALFMLAESKDPHQGAIRIGKEFSILVGAVIMSRLLFIPFHATSGASIEPSWNWAVTSEFNTAKQILSHTGTWLFTALLSMGMLIALSPSKRPLRLWITLPAALFAAGLPLLTGAASRLLSHANPPWTVLIAVSLLCTLGLYASLFSESTQRERATTGLFIAGLALTVYCELIVVMDRMNTIFKTYNSIWILLGTASFAYALLFFKRFFKKSIPLADKVPGYLSLVLGSTVLLMALAGGLVMIGIMTSFQRIQGPRPTLDGAAYLWKQDPDEAQLITWINKNIKGTPALLEAQGPSYQSYTRLSMHTGLPVVLGWDYHVKQRGVPDRQIEQRRTDIRTIYSVSDPAVAVDLLRKYGVQYVAVSSLERSTYPAAGLLKFERSSRCFIPVFKRGNAALYQVAKYGCP